MTVYESTCTHFACCCWFYCLQGFLSMVLTTWTTRGFRHTTGIRTTTWLVSVLCIFTGPGGSTTATMPIQMGCIYQTAPLMTGPCITMPLGPTEKACVQWNWCLDNIMFYNTLYIGAHCRYCLCILLKYVWPYLIYK